MKKILIIGAGFLQGFVIKKAKELGYITLAVDANPNAIGFKYADRYAVINITDAKACLEYAVKENINGVMTAATDYGVLTASYIANKMGLVGLDYEVAKLIKNKYLTRKCLYENNVDDTEQAYEIDENSNIEYLKTIIKYPVMVKPCDGSGSRGANRVDNPEQLLSACNNAIASSLSKKAEIETFVFGAEYGAESLVVNGESYVLSVMKKWMTPPPFYAELGHAIPTDLDPRIEFKAKECVKKAITALGINNGSVNMDMIITQTGSVHIIDIGARMGGNMIGPCIIPYGTGIDYMSNVIRHAVGDAVDFRSYFNTAVATRLLAFNEGIVKVLPDFNELEKEYSVEIYHNLFVGKKVNKYHTNLDGCGYIVARAAAVEEAVSNAEKVLQIISNTIF